MDQDGIQKKVSINGLDKVAKEARSNLDAKSDSGTNVNIDSAKNMSTDEKKKSNDVETPGKLLSILFRSKLSKALPHKYLTLSSSPGTRRRCLLHPRAATNL